MTREETVLGRNDKGGNALGAKHRITILDKPGLL